MQTKSNEKKTGAGRWTNEEHQRFMLGLMTHGKDWKKVEDVVATRSGSQVRSHAQKFFNKLQKNNAMSSLKKQKKSHQIQEIEEAADQQDVSFTEQNDTIKNLNEVESLNSPAQLISLIKKESLDDRKVDMSRFKLTLETEEKKKDAKDMMKQENESLELPVLNSFKSMKNILSAYENIRENEVQSQFEDESFLIAITKKYKKYFSKGGKFESLIDFGNPQQVANAIQVHQSIRKKSWTLAEGIEGDEEDLEDIKKQIKEPRNQKEKANEENGKNQTKQEKGSSSLEIIEQKNETSETKPINSESKKAQKQN